MDLPVDLESKLQATDGGPSFAVARIVFRERIASNSRAFEFVIRMTPTELDVVLARMAHAAHIDNAVAAYYAFDTELSYLESMLRVRDRPELQGLEDSSEPSPSAVDSVTPEL